MWDKFYKVEIFWAANLYKMFLVLFIVNLCAVGFKKNFIRFRAIRNQIQISVKVPRYQMRKASIYAEFFN